MTEENETKVKRKADPGIILNVLIAAGLIILYILYFSNQGSQQLNIPEDKSALPAVSGIEGSRVAFVNTDVLLERYELVKQMSREYEKEQRKRDADLKNKTQVYEEEAAYFQQSIDNQSLSEESAQKIYEQLMVKQQELYELQQKYSNEMAQQEYQMTSILLDTVKNFLHRMNLEKNYDYIFNNSIASPVLLAKDTLDITDFVLRGLNKEYKNQYGADEE